jgi:CheY-like chemotaxis protein
MNVLIADVHLETREVVSRHLGSSGHSIFAAKDGKEALNLLEAHAPGVMLLDLNLPEISALELAKIARKTPGLSKTRLIALSGGGNTASLEQADEAGFDYILIKPATAAVIDAFVSAPPPDTLTRVCRDLLKRSDEILKKSESLSLRSARARQHAADIQVKNALRIVTPNKLNLAVSKHARQQGYSRVCFVVVKIEAGRICHTGQHFPTVAAAKLYARSQCGGGYFYALNQRQTPGRTELFPSLEQVQYYLDNVCFKLAGTQTSSRSSRNKFR